MAKVKKAAASGGAGAKPIADVAHPGTTAPTDTSKPIITNRLMVKDPMVVEEDSKPEDSAPLPKKTSEVKLTPPTEPITADDSEPAEVETPATEATEAVPETTETVESKPPKAEQDSKAGEAAKAAKVQQLIDSKKYFLPINAVEQRRSKRVVTLGIVLVLLLALAWVDIALDAGLIHIDHIKPLTHFFSN